MAVGFGIGIGIVGLVWLIWGVSDSVLSFASPCVVYST